MSASLEHDSARALNPYQLDFLTLVNQIRQNHLGLIDEPLRSVPTDVFDRDVEDTLRRLASTCNRVTFFMTVSKFISKLNDAHTYLWPSRSLDWGPTLPIDFIWVGNALHVVQSRMSGNEQLLYSRVVSFNGLPLSEFEDKVNQYLSSDRNNTYYLRRYPEGNTTLMVRGALFREIGYDQDYVDIVYEKGGVKGEARVPFEKGDALPPVSLCRNDVTRLRSGNHWQVLAEEGAIYLQLNSLPTRYDSQLFDEVFSTAHRDGLRSLILDLRNNRGGWGGWNDQFLRYVVVRRTALLVFKGWQRKGNQNVPERDGYVVVEPLRRIPPFRGQIYGLVGPDTWSSATFFAVAIKDNGLGLLVGQHCGSNSLRYGHTYSTDLPNTEFRFISSCRVWERALPGMLASEEFITPHVNITYTLDDVVTQRDPVFDYVRNRIGGGLSSINNKEANDKAV